MQQNGAGRQSIGGQPEQQGAQPKQPVPKVAKKRGFAGEEQPEEEHFIKDILKQHLNFLVKDVSGGDFKVDGYDQDDQYYKVNMSLQPGKSMSQLMMPAAKIITIVNTEMRKKTLKITLKPDKNQRSKTSSHPVDQLFNVPIGMMWALTNESA